MLLFLAVLSFLFCFYFISSVSVCTLHTMSKAKAYNTCIAPQAAAAKALSQTERAYSL